MSITVSVMLPVVFIQEEVAILEIFAGVNDLLAARLRAALDGDLLFFALLEAGDGCQLQRTELRFGFEAKQAVMAGRTGRHQAGATQ